MTMSPPQLRAAAVLRHVPKAGVVLGVEVGVFVGQMSHCLLAGCQRLTLTMVDNWAETSQQPIAYRETDDFHAKLSKTQQQKNYERAEARTRRFAKRRTILRRTSAAAAMIFKPDVFDFVFLDADHSYDGVQADITLWWPTIKPGGWLCGHDYATHKQIKKHFGVCKAVDEAAALYNWDLQLDENWTWFAQKQLQPE